MRLLRLTPPGKSEQLPTDPTASQFNFAFSVKALLLLLVLGAAAYLYFRPAPVRHRYAPAGVYYLVRYYSIKSERGVVAFVPGQEVRATNKLRPVLGKVAVTDGRYTAYVDADALTDDMDVAAAIGQGDIDTQAAVHEKIAADAKRNADAKAAADIVAARAVQVASVQAAQARQLNGQSRLRDAAVGKGSVGYYGGTYVYPVYVGMRTPNAFPTPLPATRSPLLDWPKR